MGPMIRAPEPKTICVAYNERERARGRVRGERVRGERVRVRGGE
jgi:hypothetical protein